MLSRGRKIKFDKARKEKYLPFNFSGIGAEEGELWCAVIDGGHIDYKLHRTFLRKRTSRGYIINFFLENLDAIDLEGEYLVEGVRGSERRKYFKIIELSEDSITLKRVEKREVYRYAERDLRDDFDGKYYWEECRDQNE